MNAPAASRKPRKRPRSPLRKTTEITAGVLLMILAPIIGGPIIPGPFGFIGFAMGLALLLRNSRLARKRYILLKRRYPAVARWVDLGLRRRKRAVAQPLHDHRQQRQQHQPRDGQQNFRTQE